MIYEIEEYLNLSNKQKYNYLKKRMINIRDELKKLEDVMIQDNLFINVYELELSLRTMNGLKFHNINYIGDLVKCSEGFLLRAPNFGRKSLNEVKEILKILNLELGMDVIWPPCIIQYKDKRFFDNERGGL